MHKIAIAPVALLLILAAVFTFSLPARRDVLYWLDNQSGHKISLTDDKNYPCVDPSTLALATGAFDPSPALALYDNALVNYPRGTLAQINSQADKDVLAAYNASGKEKWIEVNLESEMLKAWEGGQLVKEFPVSSGLFFPTPKGTYTIYMKYRYIRMAGGSKELGDYYDLPNVPDTMFFYQGYGLHGAYWHNNFGQPMSHGCVNEPLNEAAWMFDWAGPHINPDQNSVAATPDNPGSRVVVD